MSSSVSLSPIILIPARLASTRLPEKVLADVGGAPMIVQVWKRAVASGIADVWVACDDVRVRAVLEQAGAKTVMTRADHASGSDRIFEALQAVDPEKKFNVVINLQGDMPTFDPALIQSVLKPLLHHPQTDIATLAAEISEEREKTDPAVVKAVIAEDGRALYFSRAAIPTGAGPLYHHIGIYAYRRASLERFVNCRPSPLEKRERLEQLRALEHGMRIDVDIVDTVPLGVDTQETLELARKYYDRETL